MKAYMQRMGRSLMLPVATLPVAALFSGIGYWIDPTGWGANNIVAAFLLKAGDSILANLGVLFAVGLALGMSKDRDGASALTGLVAFLVPMQLLNPAAIAAFQHIYVEKVNAAFTKMNNGNVFVGIWQVYWQQLCITASRMSSCQWRYHSLVVNVVCQS